MARRRRFALPTTPGGASTREARRCLPGATRCRRSATLGWMRYLSPGGASTREARRCLPGATVLHHSVEPVRYEPWVSAPTAERFQRLAPGKRRRAVRANAKPGVYTAPKQSRRANDSIRHAIQPSRNPAAARIDVRRSTLRLDGPHRRESFMARRGHVALPSTPGGASTRGARRCLPGATRCRRSAASECARYLSAGGALTLGARQRLPGATVLNHYVVPIRYEPWVSASTAERCQRLAPGERRRAVRAKA
jgi:hypothetical protein